MQSNISATVTINGINYNTNTSVVNITTPSYSINGGDLICSSNVYTVNNLPCNNAVTWTVTQTGSIVSSSVSGNAITLSKVSNGVVSLKAEFSSCGTPITITKTIQVGPQAATIIYGSYCIGDPITLCANPVANSTSRQWVARVNSSNVTLTESSDWCVDVPENTLYVDLFVTNDCGTVKTRQWIEYINCFTINLSPNPVDNATTLTLEQQNTKKQMDIKAIKLTNSMGVQVRQWAFGEGIKKADLNLSTLPPGIYIVSVTTDGKFWKSAQLKKQ